MLDLITRKEASEKLSMSIKTLDYLVQSGQVPFYRPTARTVRFSESELERWLKQRKNLPYRQPRK